MDINSIIAEKQINLEMFLPLDEYFRQLKEFNKTVKMIAKKQTAILKPELEADQLYEYSLPFTIYDINALDRDYIKKVLDLADKIKGILYKKFPNLTIDDNEFRNFVLSQPYFDSKNIILHLIKIYGLNEDLISLIQIQEKVKKSLPYKRYEDTHSYEPIRFVEDIEIVGNKGMRFEQSSEYNIKAITQFAQIAVGGELPSFAKGWENPKEGNVFYGKPIFDNLHFYKKGKITILFYSEEHLMKFAKAIFMTPEEILRLK